MCSSVGKEKLCSENLMYVRHLGVPTPTPPPLFGLGGTPATFKTQIQ